MGREKGYDVLILDTAGRLHVDEPLMAELQGIKKGVHPSEILLVADAMTGQDAVNIAGSFDETVGLDGIVLTKMDGDARGGGSPFHQGRHGKAFEVHWCGGEGSRL